MKIRNGLLVSLCLLLMACSKVSIENYQKIKIGMTMHDVTQILGKPTHADSLDLAGISGTTAIWSDDKIEITIQFFSDKVVIKNLTALNDRNKPMEVDAET